MGIDPGKTGAVAVLNEDGEIFFYDYLEPMTNSLIEIATTHNIDFCLIEKQQPMPKQGVKSMFTIGGIYEGYQWSLRILGIRFMTIRPQEWMKSIGVPSGLERVQRKIKIAEIVQGIYPSAELYGPRGGLLDGRSDALPLARLAKLKA